MKEALFYHLRHTDFKFYALSFFSGFGVYSLKLVSLKKIIETLNLENYPALMIGCGIFIALFNFSIEKLIKDKNHLTLFSFIFPVFVLLIGMYENNYPITSTVAVFLLSTVAINLMDSTVKHLLNQNISVLKNPNISNRLTLMEELGLFAAALLSWILIGSPKNILFILNSLPFLGLVITYFGIKYFQTNIDNNQNYPENKKINHQEFPFAFWLIGITAITLVLKQIQGFAVFLGTHELKTNGNSVESVFAILNIAQTILIFSYLYYTSVHKEEKLTWNQGQKVGLSVQGILMFMMCCIPNPFMYLFTGSARKVLQHSILNPTSTILNAVLPDSIRFQLKNKSEAYGNFISYSILGLMSYLTLSIKVHASLIWISCAFIAILGLYFRKKLFTSLAQYQIASLDHAEEFQAASASYSLATPEAFQYSEVFENRLSVTNEPIVKKAIVYTLGEIQNPNSAKKMIDEYANVDREDIQFCIIQSLLKFESHHLDLFLLENLEGIITTQVSLGEIRKNVLKAIIKRVSHIAIPSVLKILKNRNHEPRVVANAIIVLGEIAEINQDESLYDFLFLYTAEKFPRRIRSNAMIYLSKNPRFKNESELFFESLYNSQDEFDRSALAFLAGELKLKKYHKFVKANSEMKNNQNSTLLIALLKLGDLEISKNLAQVMISPEQNIAITAINQLSAIEDSLLRYKTYYHVLHTFPESYHYFVELLRLSKRDFDSDLRLLQTEAKRLGILNLEINNENGVISLQNAA
jgi:HEAT repeat protein